MMTRWLSLARLVFALILCGSRNFVTRFVTVDNVELAVADLGMAIALGKFPIRCVSFIILDGTLSD